MTGVAEEFILLEYFLKFFKIIVIDFLSDLINKFFFDNKFHISLRPFLKSLPNSVQSLDYTLKLHSRDKIHRYLNVKRVLKILT